MDFGQGVLASTLDESEPLSRLHIAAHRLDIGAQPARDELLLGPIEPLKKDLFDLSKEESDGLPRGHGVGVVGLQSHAGEGGILLRNFSPEGGHGFENVLKPGSLPSEDRHSRRAPHDARLCTTQGSARRKALHDARLCTTRSSRLALHDSLFTTHCSRFALLTTHGSRLARFSTRCSRLALDRHNRSTRNTRRVKRRTHERVVRSTS